MTGYSYYALNVRNTKFTPPIKIPLKINIFDLIFCESKDLFLIR